MSTFQSSSIMKLLLIFAVVVVGIESSNVYALQKLAKREMDKHSSGMINLDRRSSAVQFFDVSKCKEMPQQKTGPSGNILYLGTGCEYHAMGFKPSLKKRDLFASHPQSNKGFIVLPPILTKNGIRFDIQKGDETNLKFQQISLPTKEEDELEIVLEKRNPNPSPQMGLLGTAITSFATSYGQNKATKRTRTINIQASPTHSFGSNHRLVTVGSSNGRRIQPVQSIRTHNHMMMNAM